MQLLCLEDVASVREANRCVRARRNVAEHSDGAGGGRAAPCGGDAGGGRGRAQPAVNRQFDASDQPVFAGS